MIIDLDMPYRDPDVKNSLFLGPDLDKDHALERQLNQVMIAIQDLAI